MKRCYDTNNKQESVMLQQNTTASCGAVHSDASQTWSFGEMKGNFKMFQDERILVEGNVCNPHNAKNTATVYGM